MTREQMIEALLAVRTCDDEPSRCEGDSGPYCSVHYDAFLWVDLMRAAADELSKSCATCQHADIESAEDGWCYCAAPAATGARILDAQHPFRYKRVPLDERCKGWTMRQDA